MFGLLLAPRSMLVRVKRLSKKRPPAITRPGEPAVGSEAEARGRGGLGCHVHHATQRATGDTHTHTHLLQEASEVLLDLPNDHTGVSVPQHHSAHLLAMQSAIEKLGTTKMTMPAVAIACCVQRKK